MTGRVVLFTIVLVGLLGGIAGFTYWFDRATYFVGIDHGNVAIFEGRPNGMLWFHPSLLTRTSTPVSKVVDANLPLLQSGILESSYDDAVTTATNLANEKSLLGIGVPHPTTTTTTTTVATTVRRRPPHRRDDHRHVDDHAREEALRWTAVSGSSRSSSSSVSDSSSPSSTTCRSTRPRRSTMRRCCTATQVGLNPFKLPRGEILTADGSRHRSIAPTNDEYEELRVYPQGRLYTDVTGYYDVVDTADPYGMEAEYDSYLQPHTSTAKTIRQMLTEQTGTDTVVTTINSTAAEHRRERDRPLPGRRHRRDRAKDRRHPRLRRETDLRPQPLRLHNACGRRKAYNALDPRS